MLALHWNTLNNQTKQEILSGACLQERLQHYSWDELDNWLKSIIIVNMKMRSHSTVTIIA